MHTTVLVLLIASAIMSVFGIIFSLRKQLQRDDDESWYVDEAEGWWKQNRALLLLAGGLLLNTASGIFALTF